MLNESLLLGVAIGSILTFLLMLVVLKQIKVRGEIKRKEYTYQFSHCIDQVREDINRYYRTMGAINKNDLLKLTQLWGRIYQKVSFTFDHDGEIFNVTIKNTSGEFNIAGHFKIPPYYLTSNWIYKV
jgi:hypothetical protein